MTVEPTAASGHTLVDLLVRRADRYPRRPALRDDDRVLDSADLLREVRARAAALSGQGWAPGSPVAVAVRRDLESVLAVLAVLAAGFAYVPIDAGWPAQRRDFVLADVAASGMVETTPSGLEVTELDPPTPVSLPDGTAYVLYTSGSSGRPKGVAVSHDNVLSMLDATAQELELRPDDVWTVFHSLGFDVSVWEIWGALRAGACAVIIGQRTATDPTALLDKVRRHGVTVLSLVPSIFARFADACAAQGWPPLTIRYVVLGGEAIDPRQSLRWLDRQPDSALINMYGITEATVHATFRALDHTAVAGASGATPIGRALPNLTIDLLDPDGRPVPTGDTGEIVISGAGVALGYIANPVADAARFVVLDIDGFPRRCLRTGDLAVRDAHGELHYIGRSDQQIKVNGYRIEPGEIEAVVAADPRVTSCVATTVTHTDGSNRLALIVASDDVDLTPPDVRRRLVERLPAYLIPGLVYVEPELPLSGNGKLDRTASRNRIEELMAKGRYDAAR